MAEQPPKYRTLVEGSEWALSFLAHRDWMNAAVHGSGKVKWSQATRHVALGLMIAGERSYEVQQVMYSWDASDPDLSDWERRAIDNYFDEIR